MQTRALIALIVLAAFGLAAFWVVFTHPGEKGEDVKVAEKSDLKEQGTSTSEDLLGLWKSTGDVSFTREFKEDGEVVDRYSGSESATVVGEWEIFTAENPAPGAWFPLEEDSVYVRIMFDGEAYHYLIASVSETALELVYLDRGGVLQFEKVQ